MGSSTSTCYSRAPFTPPGLLTHLLQVAGSRREAAGCPAGLGLRVPAATAVAMQPPRAELGASGRLSSSEPATNFLETCEKAIIEIEWNLLSRREGLNVCRGGETCVGIVGFVQGGEWFSLGTCV